MTARPFSPAELKLAGVFADTDFPPAEIASRLGVSPRRFARVRTRIYQAYGVRSRAGLRFAMLALELGAPR